jgi:hypothetical protein
MDVARWRARAGAAPAGLLGMLALVLAAESFVTRHRLDVMELHEWQYRLARRTAARAAAGRDVLYLGDSLMKVGVLPRVVESRSGLRGHNLAILASQAPASYDVLRRALAGGARPRLVLVDFYPMLLAQPPRLNADHWPHLLGFFDCLELCWKARDASLGVRLVVRESLPSVRGRVLLRLGLVAALNGSPPTIRQDTLRALAHWARYSGAQLMPSRAWPDSALEPFRRGSYPPGWVPDRVNADYLRRFLALAEAHGVTVCWLLPPAFPAIEEGNARSGFEARYLAYVRHHHARFPNLIVLDGRHAGYDPRLFFDPDHLGREGALAFSEDLGDALRHLRRGAPPDRWVRLPRYRPRPAEPGVDARLAEIFGPETGTALR